MWTGQRSAGQKESYQPWVERGVVTQSQEVMGVYLDGERRQFLQVSPGGYQWKPKQGETVLVLKENQGDGSQHIVGTCGDSGDLNPGDVVISGGGLARVALEGDLVTVTGELRYQGQSLEEYIQGIVRGMM